MSSKITWKEAFLISVISLTITFPGFLLYQVIWGDTLKDTLDPKKLGSYSTINFILYIGLFSVFGVSFLVNTFIYRNYTLESKLATNLLALAITAIALFMFSFLFMFVLFPSLNIYHILGLWPYYYFYYAIYGLPHPVYFWYLALLIYHYTLIVMIKLFYIPKLIYVKKSHKKQQKVYQSQVIR